MKYLQLFLCTIGLATISSTSLTAQSQDDWVEWGYVDGLNQGDSFGSAMLPLGDVNNDLYEDYLVASPQSGSYLRRAGELSIHSGQDNSVIASVYGSSMGQQMGYSICILGTHNNDGLLKIAASSPFSNSSNGMFSGVVNIYAFDLNTLSFDLWQELTGDNAGAMFGVSVAALDYNSDGDLDLAVGSIGDSEPLVGQQLDGSIRFFEVSDLIADETVANSKYGEPNSAEMFGFAMCYANINNEEGLLIGAPFANADNSGAAILYQASSNQLLMPPLEDPLPTADANLGFAVAAGSDITGDGKADFIASAPNAGTGTVITWRLPLEIGRSLNGSNSGEKFGYSVAITTDSNFNDSDDLVVGAPEAGNDNGRFAVHDMSSLDQTVLYSENGSTGQLFGSAVATAGDVNQSTKSEILVGAIGENNMTGRVYIYSPPEQDIGPIELEVVGNYEWETDLNLNATNLSQGGGGELHWYMGSKAGSSVVDGYELDIGGNVLLLASTSNPGVQAQYTHTIPDTIADGQLLVFQVVEDRSGFIRSSTIDGGNVVDPGVTMFVDGNQAGAQIQVRTKWGMPNSPVYIYGSKATPTGSASNNAPDGNWDLNLRNAKPIGSPGDQSDLIGNFTSAPINVPASLSGVTAYFQAYDWDFFESALTPVLVVTFQ